MDTTQADTTPQNKIASLSTEEKLKLMELLAEDVWQAYPDSLILPQVIYHVRYLRGVVGKKQGGGK